MPSTPRYLMKYAASLVATVLGTMLLVADEDDSCENYEPFQQSLAFTSDCPFAPDQGRLTLDYPPQKENGPSLDEALAQKQLEAAGFSIYPVVRLDFIGTCARDDGQKRIGGLSFSLGNRDTPMYGCHVPLPVSQSWTVSCSRSSGDASVDSKRSDAGGAEPAACSIVFRTAAR